MSDKGFYTPKQTHSKETPFKTPISVYYTPANKTNSDDSEESANSNDEFVLATPTNNSGNGELTLVAEFDELLRLVRQQRTDAVENAFSNTVEQVDVLINQLQMSVVECRRLQDELDIKTHCLSDFESKLNHARKMVDQEKKHSRRLEDERDILRAQIRRVHEFLFKDARSRIPDEAREKLSFLNYNQSHMWDPNVVGGQPQLSAIQEINTTGSLLSDFSYSRSEDDLNVSDVQNEKRWKKHRPSTGQLPEPAYKKRRSSTNKVVEITNTDSVRATTTLTVPKNGPITATSIIESVPTQHDIDGKAMEAEVFPNRQPATTPKANIIYDMWQNTPKQFSKPAMRQHCLQAKTIVMPDTCGPCEKRIRFGKTAMKCKDCRATCHPECKNDLPLPCIPFVNTPPQRFLMGLISDYTPTTPPMVPAIIVHCLNEIELRGLNEIGIYRIPGAERDVKQLKERFMRGKGSPCLNQIDIHVICGTVKDFLRSLQEPITTYRLWPNFVKCVESQDEQNIVSCLYQVVSELPQPNRDTLAYMILHLKRVGESKECKMPISNLSKIFGPTIVGYSSNDPSTETLLLETRQQNIVMESLMNLPNDYWESFVNVMDQLQIPKLQQTPSTDSLLRPNSKGFFTPHSIRSTKKKQKVFRTPPIYKY